MKRKLLLGFVLSFMVLFVLGCGKDAESPTDTPKPTVVQPTKPPPTETMTLEPTETKIPLGDEYRSEDGGYSVRTIPDYELTEDEGFLVMLAPDGDTNNGPTLVMSGETTEKEITLDEFYANKADELAKEELVLSSPEDTMVGGLPARSVEISGVQDDVQVEGRVMFVVVSPQHTFLIGGMAPVDRWEDELAPLYEAVLETVEFFEPVVVETETPTPKNELAVDMVQGYQDAYGSWIVVGLVTNYTDRDVDSIEVEVSILDEDGNDLYTDAAWVFLYKLAPGETTPFRMAVSEDLVGVDSFSAEIVGKSTAEIDRAEIEVRGVSMIIDDSGNIHISGEIVNTGTEPADIDDVAAATFDKNGQIVTADASTVYISYLDPGESGPFRIFTYGPAEGVETITDQTVYLNANVGEQIADIPLSFGEHRAYLDHWDTVHLMGEIENKGEEPLSVILVGAFYDEDGNVLDAESYSLPVDLAPGEMLPFDLNTGWTALENKTGMMERVSRYLILWDSGWTWTSSETTIDIKTANDEQEFVDEGITFTGQIVNNSGETLDKAVVIISVRDKATGELIATDYGSVYDDLAPGDKADYYVRIEFEADSGYDESNVEYLITVKGEL
jgi:hypothetical protein